MAENPPIDNKPIEGKVATVLNERELAINIGTNHGVEVEMKFKVLADEPTEVLDPITGEALGVLDRTKVKVKVVETHEKFSVCRTYRERYVGGGPLYNSFRGLAAYADLTAEPRAIPETLKAKDSALPPPLSPEESFVKKGDRVVQLLIDDD